MQSIQLCGPVLPPPKLPLSTERSTPPTTETRAAETTIRRIDHATGSQPCAYCQSGLYDAVPDPCPACCRDPQYLRDVRSMTAEAAGALLRHRREQRSMPEARPPLGTPLEIRPAGPILSMR